MTAPEGVSALCIAGARPHAVRRGVFHDEVWLVGRTAGGALAPRR